MTGQPTSPSRRERLARVLGIVLLTLLLLPALRQLAESRMVWHMLVQFPALLLAGALLVGWLRPRWTVRVQRCNELGIAGLLAVALTLAMAMVPRLLDLALLDARVEALKLLALLLSGAALRLSWQRAGNVVQAFFLGNVLPMMTVAGTLFLDAPTRLCNAYLLDDQQTLGAALIAVSVAVLAAWLLQLQVQQRRRTALQTGETAGPVRSAARR